jgi:ATP-dependent helicase/nuclease subunit A
MRPSPEQRRAAEPAASVWVAANAGSGKTAVLTNRVARLLLAGSEPARILCLTYTKAAAAEMQTRLFSRLGAWAMLDDAALIRELRELGEPPERLCTRRLAVARTLFARALETPGGLKIQTIHAFCDSLLRRFPLEAGVPPGFTVLDDRQAQALRLDALERLAETDPRVVEGMGTHLSGDDPDPLLAEIATHRDRFDAPLDEAALATALGHRQGVTLAGLAAAVLTSEARGLLRDVASAAASGGVKDQEAAAAIAGALCLDPAEALRALEGVLLFGANAGAPFTARTGKFPGKDARRALGPRADALDGLMAAVEEARCRRLALLAFEKSRALHVFARGWLAQLARLKVAGLLDFDDLIAHTVRLLSNPETAAFVLWRLDGGLDHLLVDEAQDTSPPQWRVIQAITEEFFAGEGARSVDRTVFVVGDEKQSIYSFQGADPAAFADMRAHFEARLEGMERQLDECDLIDSFRSAPLILELVDAVFAGPAGAAFVDRVTHQSPHPERPGRIELWPFVERPEKPEEPPWDRPLDLRMPDNPALVLAEQLASEIRRWLDEGRPIPDPAGSRPIRPGDILVLVQRRSSVFHPLIRALKRHRVPVAGADVLRMGGELAVKDLLAALRIATTPVDDLSLAALLRSPLGGLSEQELFRLAHPRERTLVDALARSDHRAAADLVQDLRSQADYVRPYELIEHILVRHEGRRRLTARLGAEANDGIDALLEQALAYEAVETPTLTGFLAWMGRGEVTVKRRTDEAGDEVRVMTVHGAKGLQAPVVILPDTAQWQEAGRRPQITLVEGGIPMWTVSAAECPPPLAAAERERRARTSAENRRLLYVALTRAQSLLVVAGAGERGKTEADSWFACVQAALLRCGAEYDAAGLLVRASRWPVSAAAADSPVPSRIEAAPWARSSPPRPLGAAPLLTPSTLGGLHAMPGEIDRDGDPRDRGSRIHRLLEGLATQPRLARAALARRLLPDAADLAELLAEAEAVLDAPELATLFAPEARPEVGITATLGGRTLFGRIDRLVVGTDSVLAADFKSNRVVPESLDDVPEAILRQMGAYAAALALLYPGQSVETAVVWTRIPTLMMLPQAATAAALARALP